MRVRPELREWLLGKSVLNTRPGRQLTRTGQHVLGLAIRMAEHMGSYKDAPEIFEDKDHYIRNKLLFWSLFVQDRLLSLSTGRLCTVC